MIWYRWCGVRIADIEIHGIIQDLTHSITGAERVLSSEIMGM